MGSTKTTKLKQMPHDPQNYPFKHNGWKAFAAVSIVF